MFKDKKAQSLGGLYSGILIIASIGIMLALILYILSAMGTSFLTPNTAVSAVNESVTSSKTLGLSATLYAGGLADGSCGTITQVVNGTGSAVVIAVGNFTQVGCTVTNASSMVIYGTALLFSYPYTWSADTNSSLAMGTVITQFVNFLPWLGIILLVLAAGVVLFFVIRSFAGGGKGV